MRDPPISAAEPPQYPRLEHVPRLSIRYLLLWTGYTAAALLIFNLLGLQETRPELVTGLLIVALSTVLGWLWMAMAIIGWHALRGSVWRIEPGEWLLLGLGAFAVAWLLIIVFITHLESRTHSPAVTVLFMLMPLAVAVFQLGVISRSHSKAWRMIHILTMMAFLSPWCLFVTLLLLPLIVPLLVVAVLGDHRRGAARHWLHFSGVAIYGFVAAMGLLWEIVAIAGWIFG